jgi:chromosome segregation ATPase
MKNKLKLTLFIFPLLLLYSQNISIFFLKDGSIIQGTIVNENQSRIFLKTNQGTVKIYPIDVIGREDSAKEGELSFFSERIEYLQTNVHRLTGKVNNWSDSLNIALKDLYDLNRNLEVIQNEIEIDLLRVHSRERDLKRNVEYLNDDILDHRVDISKNTQDITALIDSLKILSDGFFEVKQKLDVTGDQSYLLSGTVSNINKDLQSFKLVQQNQQNQIDIISGSLANIIQEVQKVQLSFSTINLDLDKNKNSLIHNSGLISDLSKDFNENNIVINDSLKSIKGNLRKNHLKISSNLEEQKFETESKYKKINSNIDDIQIELDNFKSKLKEMNKNLSDAELDIRSVNKDLTKVSDKMEKVSSKIKAVSDKVEENLQNK